MRSVRPTISSAASACSLRSRRGKAGEQERQLHVLERRQHRHQVVELKDEADVPRPPVGELRFVERRDVHRRPRAASPASGLSIPAIRLSSVLLPEPDGPISATKSPAAMAKEMSLQHRHDLIAAPIGLGEVVDFDDSDAGQCSMLNEQG